MTRVEKIILGWFAAIFIFLIFAVNTPFWQAYFYGIWQIAFGLFIYETRRKINFYLMWSAFIFDLEYFGYNILIAYKKAPHPKVFVLIFIISIIVLLLTTFFYNVWHLRR